VSSFATSKTDGLVSGGWRPLQVNVRHSRGRALEVAYLNLTPPVALRISPPRTEEKIARRLRLDPICPPLIGGSFAQQLEPSGGSICNDTNIFVSGGKAKLCAFVVGDLD